MALPAGNRPQPRPTAHPPRAAQRRELSGAWLVEVRGSRVNSGGGNVETIRFRGSRTSLTADLNFSLSFCPCPSLCLSAHGHVHTHTRMCTHVPVSTHPTGHVRDTRVCTQRRRTPHSRLLAVTSSFPSPSSGRGQPRGLRTEASAGHVCTSCGLDSESESRTSARRSRKPGGSQPLSLARKRGVWQAT